MSDTLPTREGCLRRALACLIALPFDAEKARADLEVADRWLALHDRLPPNPAETRGATDARPDDTLAAERDAARSRQPTDDDRAVAAVLEWAAGQPAHSPLFDRLGIGRFGYPGGPVDVEALRVVFRAQAARLRGEVSDG